MKALLLATLTTTLVATCAEYDSVPEEWPPRARPSKSTWEELETPVKVIGGIVAILGGLYAFTGNKGKKRQ